MCFLVLEEPKSSNMGPLSCEISIIETTRKQLPLPGLTRSIKPSVKILRGTGAQIQGSLVSGYQCTSPFLGKSTTSNTDWDMNKCWHSPGVAQKLGSRGSYESANVLIVSTKPSNWQYPHFAWTYPLSWLYTLPINHTLQCGWNIV